MFTFIWLITFVSRFDSFKDELEKSVLAAVSSWTLEKSTLVRLQCVVRGKVSLQSDFLSSFSGGGCLGRVFDVPQGQT